VAGSKKRSTPEKRTLIVWALLARDNAAAFQNELKPEPEKADREALSAEGLIRWDKRGQRIWIEVRDKGWEWAGKNLDAALPTNSSAAGPILQAWLKRLKAFMEARGMVLADVLGPQKPPPPAQLDYQALRARIRQAYLDSTGGRLNTRALLRDIREKLQDIERGTLDEALRQMQQEQEAALYQMDNRVELTDADRTAAIYFGNEPRHILWIER